MSAKHLNLIAAVSVSGLIVFCGTLSGFSAETQDTENLETKADHDPLAFEEEASTPGTSFENQEVFFDEQKLIQLSQTLKNLIEENEELLKDKGKLLEDLKQVKGQHEADTDRLNALTAQRDQLKTRMEELTQMGQIPNQKLKDLQLMYDQKNLEWETKIKKLEDRLSVQEKLNEDLENMRAPANR